MFAKILVPVDLTDTHQQAIEIAAQLAGESGGQVILLHVVEVIPGLWVDEERDFFDRLEAAARDHLVRLGRQLEERSIPRREEIIFGNRAEEIVRYAMEAGVDLIVLKSHRIDLKNPGAGWGTLSYKISILSQCPVLLVK
ncbi:MAG TPA: universal stress protein [Candidatus Tectomicrobia bacterium]|nr:universal stress protein [Candidatus Tectomicrobia bacterium]